MRGTIHLIAILIFSFPRETPEVAVGFSDRAVS